METKQIISSKILLLLAIVRINASTNHTTNLIHQRPITAICTAFCPCKICCGPDAKGITASGKVPVQGRTIAVPRNIPLGTKIEIAGKLYIAEDRTARKYDGRFDIYFDSHEAARKFGIRTNQVTIWATNK